MSPFEHRIAHCGFSLVRKTKTSNKRQMETRLNDPVSSIGSVGSLVLYCIRWCHIFNEWRLEEKHICEELIGSSRANNVIDNYAKNGEPREV